MMNMQLTVGYLAFLWLTVAAGSAEPAWAPAAVLEQAGSLEAVGEFAQAETLLAEALSQPRMEAGHRDKLAFARERLRRIRKDYNLTEQALWAALQRAVRNLTEAEFRQWLAEGRFDGRLIDGSRRFINVSVSNLFFRYPELEPRRLKPARSASVQRALWGNALSIRAAARAAGRPYVLPKRFRVHMSVRVVAEAVAAGELVRAWLPVPRRYPFQDEFILGRCLPPHRALAPPDSPIRSVYFEQMALNGRPTSFELNYEYTAWGVWFDLDPARARALSGADEELLRFTGEGPHIVFSPAMRKLAEEIAGAETNLVRKARRFYDWIASQIHYSFAPEYSTVRNLGEFCRSRGYGDCGQQALLFITLCRLTGLPARWQSGWSIFPGAQTMHDWCEIYLAPWGWVPVDPYMGIYATQYATGLSAEQRRQLSGFYFGGLSQYRLAANSDHCQRLRPAKRAFRSDPVDFQRGEVEAGGRNLYFDQFNYALTWEEEPPPAKEP